MGQNPSSAMESFTLPHLRGKPSSLLESKYDPLYGFPKGRKKREMIATEDEMDSAKLPYYLRDYCAHHMIKMLACRRDNKPFIKKCDHYKHNYHDCLYEDALLRMKEYEREKRLDARNKRIREAEAKWQSSE